MFSAVDRQIKFNFIKLIKYLSEEADFDMYLHNIKNGRQKVTLTHKIKVMVHVHLNHDILVALFDM